MPARRILLVRLDGLGDALVCTPLIAALRTAGHELGLALSDRNADVFAPDAARAVHVLERIPWPRHGSTPASRERAEREIAAADYELALIASEEPEAYELAAPIAERVGFVTGWAKPFKTLWARRRLTRALVRPATVGRSREHEAQVLYRLAAGMVDAAPPREPAQLRRWITGSDVVPARHGLVVQLGAKWGSIGVSEAALRAVVATLRARGARFIAAPAELDALRTRYPELAFEAPPTTRDWIAAIDRAAALVSVDTGTAHLAGMLGVPVVDVFADAHFEEQTRRWRPWASASIVLRASELVRAPQTLVGQALDAL